MIFTHPRCLQMFPNSREPSSVTIDSQSKSYLHWFLKFLSLKASLKNMKNEVLCCVQTPRHRAMFASPSCHVGVGNSTILELIHCIVPHCSCIVPQFFQWQPPRYTLEIVSGSMLTCHDFFRLQHQFWDTFQQQQ